jgi:hypothetical protein
MSFVPYYLQILKEGKTPLQPLNEDMGDPNEATPVELLKKCLPWLEIVSKTLKDGEHNTLMDLIVSIEGLVGRGSITPDKDVWKASMHGGQRPPAHKQILGSAGHE